MPYNNGEIQEINLDWGDDEDEDQDEDEEPEDE